MSTLLPFTAGLRLMVHSLLIQPNRIDPAGCGAMAQSEFPPSSYSMPPVALHILSEVSRHNVKPTCRSLYCHMFHLNLNYFTLPFRRPTQPKESSEGEGKEGCRVWAKENEKWWRKRELLWKPEVTSVRELQLASSFRWATDLIINITWVVWAWRVQIKPELLAL